MRLLFFASLKAVHTRKWLQEFAQDFDIHVATFRADKKDYLPGVTIHEILPEKKQTLITKKQSAQVNRNNQTESTAWETFKIGLRYGHKFTSLIDKLRPDIVHAHQSVPFGWYAARALSRTLSKPRFIISVWGTDVMRYPEQSWLYRALNRYTLARAETITATGNVLKQATQRWINDKNIQVVPFGVDINRFKPRSTPPNSVRIFGMAKSLRTVAGLDIYGIETAIKAFYVALKNKPDLQLEIVGEGPMRLRLQNLINDLNLSQNVKLLGQVSQEKMPECWRRWDLLLLPSKQESFGLVALEAQASGLPILASRVGGIPEITLEHKTVRFVEPMTPNNLAQAILKSLNDQDFIINARKFGPKHVADNYAWSECAKKMKIIYISL